VGKKALPGSQSGGAAAFQHGGYTMKQQAFLLLSAMTVLGGLAACGQVPGAGVVPQDGARQAMTIRAIPIHSPEPTPTPSPTPQPHGHSE